MSTTPLTQPVMTVPAFRLTVAAGADQGRELVVDGTQPSRVLLGQSATSAIPLTDRHVSRRHAAIDVTPHGLRLTDLGSTNGTWVNGLRIVDAYLRGGETIRIGETTFHVVLLAPDVRVPLSEATRFGELVGASPAMRKLHPLLERLASSDIPLIIEGETGTGKEVLAESLHQASARAAGPLVIFDCTTVSASLVESALFGHEKGAFTGATSTRRGVFEQAHGGTLLIDEIGDLDASLQPKLLRAVQHAEVQRIGSERWISVDVRVMAATRRDLESEVQARRFRDDLFYRLAVARVELPPLREREGDVDLLARHFWAELAGDAAPFPAEFLDRYEGYRWPGNVRELYNLVARRLALGEFGASEPAETAEPPPTKDSDDIVTSIVNLELPFSRARQEVVEEFERRYIEHMLRKHGGNVSRAAVAAGLARRYLHEIIARHRK